MRTIQWVFVISIITLLTSCSKDTESSEFQNISNTKETDIFRSTSDSPAYYINSEGGNDELDGRSPQTAWKTLDRLHKVVLKSGDVVRLARGSVWQHQNIMLDNGSSGTEESPVIIEAYGEGVAPAITQPRALWDKTKPYSAVYFADNCCYINVLDLLIKDTGNEYAIYMTKNTHHIVIAGNEITNCGTGINIDGHNQKIIANYIHDTGISRVGSGIGIQFAGSNIEMAWNELTNCVVWMQNGNYDGSPFEYYGRRSDSDYDQSDNISIHHNIVDNCLNFIEAYGNATNMTIAYNVYKNSTSSPFQMHLDDCEHPTWTHECTYDLTIENNTMVCTTEPTDGGWGIVGLLVDWDHLPDPQKSKVVVRNNIFVTNHTILSWTNPLGDNLIHDHNLFYFVNKGTLCVNKDVWILNETEKIADPKFRDLANGDFRITETSPAIKAGTITNFTVDLQGNAVPSGSAADNGAYHY